MQHGGFYLERFLFLALSSFPSAALHQLKLPWMLPELVFKPLWAIIFYDIKMEKITKT